MNFPKRSVSVDQSGEFRFHPSMVVLLCSICVGATVACAPEKEAFGPDGGGGSASDGSGGSGAGGPGGHAASAGRGGSEAGGRSHMVRRLRPSAIYRPV